jgi:hypothetical protein
MDGSADFDDCGAARFNGHGKGTGIELDVAVARWLEHAVGPDLTSAEGNAARGGRGEAERRGRLKRSSPTPSDSCDAAGGRSSWLLRGYDSGFSGRHGTVVRCAGSQKCASALVDTYESFISITHFPLFTYTPTLGASRFRAVGERAQANFGVTKLCYVR